MQNKEVSTGTDKLGQAMGTVIGGSLAGGLGATIAGGNFWDGARNGAISAGLNHAWHMLDGPKDPPKKNQTTGQVSEVLDDATSPYVGFGLKVAEDFGDDIWRGLGSGGATVNKILGPVGDVWGTVNMVKTANNPNISDTRMAYDLAKNGIPIAIDVAVMLGLVEATPAGWVATGIGVTMEGGQLFYDKVYTPTMNYLLDYSNRWDQWFINGGYNNFSSDQRLKTEITEIDSILEKLLLLHAYRFKWKANNTNSDIGLLAQEVEGVFPELVLTDSIGYKQIAYHKLVPILLQAIKEQDSIIKQQIFSIEKSNKQLEYQRLLLNDVIQRLNQIEKDI